ncbi:MAG: ABC transporter substrate-binding protein [Bacteroidetes bacterium]|nr:ABC transporter substrate-binding protein [Bacteroidota bacterium]MCL5026131.1 ABC transporter substrate-binding protein [Chloroflexota bacterium]
MRARIHLVSVLTVLALLGACAPAAPTIAPTKPQLAPTAVPIAAPQAPPTVTPAPAVKRGGILKYASNKDTDSWDPIFSGVNEAVSPLAVYETLVRWNLVDEKTGKHDIGPELAESWKFEDPTHLILSLRKGVKFHDGSDFNAEVVKWNLERARDDKKSLAKRLVENVSAVDVVDPYTVKLSLKAPSALTLPDLTRSTGGTGSSGTMMASKAAWEKLGGDSYASKPSGTGPMKFVGWARDDKTTVTRWESYWAKGVDGKPLPYIDGIEGRIIRDKAVILVELRTGTVDASYDAVPQAYESIKANPDLRLWLLPWAASRQMIGFNQDKPPFGGNIRLMQAAQYAVDREALAKTVGFGVGEPLNYGAWIPSWPGYDESLPRYEYNPTKAKQLVREAGFPDGVETELAFQTTTPLADKASEMIERMWNAVGIRTKLWSAETLAFKARNKAGEFQAANWYMSSSPDIAYYNRMYLSDGSANWSNFHDVEVDKCIREGASLIDFDTRDKVYKRCIKLVYETAALQGLYALPYNFVYRKEVKGVREQLIDLDLREVWLDK